MTKGVTKIKKVAFISLCCVVASLIVIAGSYTLYVQCHKNEAIEYLTKKYGFDSKNLMLLDYKPSKFHDDTDLGIPFDWYRTNSNWKFKYKGKTFSVVRDIKKDNELYDNYQLEDLFDWSTELLQSQIDKNIIGIKIDNETFSEKLSAEDIELYLEKQSSLTIYYKVDNISKYFDGYKYNENYLYKSIKDEIITKCKNSYNINNIEFYIIDSDIEFKRKLDSTRETKYLYCIDTKEKTYVLYDNGNLIGRWLKWLKESLHIKF